MLDETRLGQALAGRYTIERQLGQGGMATVYLAHDVKHDRQVAIKVLRPDLAAVIGADRFLAEIKTTASLQHPHILPLFDSGQAVAPPEVFLFYVMPYVEGESLRERLNRETQLPVDEAVRIAGDIAGALDYAHRKGVIHRDIKPENVMLHDGRPMVADFGIALALRSAGSTRMTETGTSLGTPQYMSPEQATADREITPRSDIYSLGAVLYEMLAGDPPHTGSSAQAVIAAVVTEEPRPIMARRKTVPPYVAAAIHMALQKIPADRFATAADFAAALQRPDPVAMARWLATSPSGAARPWIRDWRSWVTLGAAAGGLALAAWRLKRNAGPAGPLRFNLTVPASAIVDLDDPSPAAVAPDGSAIVYTAMVHDSGSVPRSRLFLRRFDTIDPTPIPGTDSARSPFFSPDSRWIGFWVGFRLAKVPLAGGAAVVISDSTRGRGGDGAWGDDGSVWYTGRNGALYRVPGVGGTPQLVYRDSTGTLSWPNPLPDGRVLALHCLGTCDQHADIAVVNPASHALTTITPAGEYARVRYLNDGYLVYTRSDDALLAAPFDLAKGITGTPVPLAAHVASYGVSSTGTLLTVGTVTINDALVTVERSGAERPLAPQRRDFLFPATSPDGGRVAVEIHDASGGHIWVYDVVSQTLTRLTSVGHNTRPAWSPDGTRIAFISSRDSLSGIYWVPADGSGPEHRVSRRGFRFLSVTWSRDGKNLLYWVPPIPGNPPFASRRGAPGLYLLPVTGESDPQLIAGATFAGERPVLSPDGRWLAYVSSESGENDVYVRAFPGPGGRWAVSINGASEPVWGPSGRELFYRGRDGWLYAATLVLNGDVTVTHRERLFDTSPYLAFGQDSYDVFPDGRRFVFVRRENHPPDITVTTNWTDEMERLLRGPVE